MSAPTDFQAPPLDCESPVFDQPWWARTGISLLNGFPKEIKVCSPCVGLNAPERAARELQVPWKSVDVYDTNSAVWPALAKLGNEGVHIGGLKGDVMLVDIKGLRIM